MATSPGARLPGRLLLALSIALGGGSLLAFALHLWGIRLTIVRLGSSDAARLATDAGLSLIFFLQHSLMVRGRVREWLLGGVRPEFRAAVYSIASGVALLLVVLCWQTTEATLIALEGPARWPPRALFALGLIGFLWAERSLDSLDGLGLGEIRDLLSDRRRPQQPPLGLAGPYRWVRHPLYLSTLLLVWSCPDLSADRLLFNLLWSAWIVTGAALEERDLVARYGAPYREYQRRVPMLLPLRRPTDG